MLIWHKSKAVAVFTGKSKETILADGGSQSWVAQRERLEHTPFIVCVRSNVSWAEGPEEPGTAFLVGRISGVIPSTDDPERSLILIREYADVSVPGVWKGWRNPVRYSNLEELGINFGALVFKNMPPRPVADEAPDESLKADDPPPPGVVPLTIAQARHGLALGLGVKPEAIEINIRG